MPRIPVIAERQSPSHTLQYTAQEEKIEQMRKENKRKIVIEQDTSDRFMLAIPPLQPLPKIRNVLVERDCDGLLQKITRPLIEEENKTQCQENSKSPPPIPLRQKNERTVFAMR